MTEVDEQVRALRRSPDPGPRRVGAVDLGDGGAVRAGQLGVAASAVAVVAGAGTDGTDDDDDLDAGAPPGVPGNRQGAEADDQCGDECSDDQTRCARWMDARWAPMSGTGKTCLLPAGTSRGGTRWTVVLCRRRQEARRVGWRDRTAVARSVRRPAIRVSRLEAVEGDVSTDDRVPAVGGGVFGLGLSIDGGLGASRRSMAASHKACPPPEVPSSPMTPRCTAARSAVPARTARWWADFGYSPDGRRTAARHRLARSPAPPSRSRGSAPATAGIHAGAHA